MQSDEHKVMIRKTVSFPEELADKILERAKESNRSFSAQVVYDMTQIVEILILNTKIKGVPPRNITNEWPSSQESSIEE